MPKKRRLDEALMAGGQVEEKGQAFVLVTEGRVFVNGQKAVSPAQLVTEDDRIEVRPGREFVGRGAYKLEAAIQAFGIGVAGLICADVGAATGGFTEVLLKQGAKKVYAIDVGRGKLDLKLRENPRVVVMEGVNVLALDRLPEPVDLVAVDVSFIPLQSLLPAVRPWLRREEVNTSGDRLKYSPGRTVALLKPQYEIEDKSLLKHGVLRDETVRLELIERFRVWLGTHGWQELGCMESPIRGAEGNTEYLFYLKPQP